MKTVGYICTGYGVVPLQRFKEMQVIDKRHLDYAETLHVKRYNNSIYIDKNRIRDIQILAKSGIVLPQR